MEVLQASLGEPQVGPSTGVKTRSLSMQNWKASASTTLIGSLPHRNRDHAIGIILENSPEIPIWPQLSAYAHEQMMVQYLEGLPGLKENDGRVFVDTDAPEFDDELLQFYDEYLQIEAGSKDLDGSRFQMGPETSRTFSEFLSTAGRDQARFRAVKGHVVGPFTLLAGMKDQRDRALLYDDRLQDLVPKHLALKARWQIRKLQTLGTPVILFLDEPALAGYGSSAFISVSEDLILSLLREVVAGVHQEDGLAGIHVCANTDWNLAFKSGTDIVNLDAYSYLEKFLLYQREILKFIEDGGVIAWGMVPTSDPAAITKESANALADRWLAEVQPLLSTGLSLSKLLDHSLFTPSCGCGSLSEPMAERVLNLTRELGQIMKSRLARET
jgi:methionine synthase II (cobalamin-independent)